MPDFWSHQVASIRTLDLYKAMSPVQWKWDKTTLNYYYLGAQGPDIFFYINRTNPFDRTSYKEIGGYVHNQQIQTTIKELVLYAHAKKNTSLMAYVSGLLSHYTMDVHCHPLISKWGPSSKSHKAVEIQLDALTVKDMTGKDIRQSSLAYWQFDPQILSKDIADLWNHVLIKNFQVSVPANCFTRATLDLYRIQRLLLSDAFSKIPFLGLLSKWVKYDLTALVYPKEKDPILENIDYPTYKTQYLRGIETSAICLKRLDDLLIKRQALDQWIDTYFTHDYMGREINHAS